MASANSWVIIIVDESTHQARGQSVPSDCTLVHILINKIFAPLAGNYTGPKKIEDRDRPRHVSYRSHKADYKVIKPEGFFNDAPCLLICHKERYKVKCDQTDTDEHQPSNDDPEFSYGFLLFLCNFIFIRSCPWQSPHFCPQYNTCD